MVPPQSRKAENKVLLEPKRKLYGLGLYRRLFRSRPAKKIDPLPPRMATTSL